MKLVNWRYPQARVFIRYDQDIGFEKSIRRAIGIIIGQSFIGWMRTDEKPTAIERPPAPPPMREEKKWCG